MKRAILGLTLLSIILAVVGCGGGGTASSGGSTGGTGGGTTTIPQAKGTALVTVNALTNTATVTPLDPSSRAIFSGAALALSSVKVNEDAGEVTTRQIGITVTNNTQGPLSNLRFTISQVKPVIAPVTDIRTSSNVTTFAGNGNLGTGSGAPLTTPVSDPFGMWMDTDGTVYYTTTANPAIRKVSGGVNSTVISMPGILPYGLVGGSTFLYFCDYSHDVIWRIRKDGTGQAIIGGVAGSTGSTDGAVGTCKFNQPTGITMDQDGNLWIADFLNNKIRKITSPGSSNPITSTIATTGFISIASPYSIADAVLDGTEYLAVGQFSSVGKVYLINLATSACFPLTGGTATNANVGPANTVAFNTPKGLAFVNGNLVVVENGRNEVKVISRSPGDSVTDTTGWTVAALAGQGDAGFSNGTGDQATFNAPTGVIQGQDGGLLISDTNNSRIRHISANFNLLSGAGSAPATGTVVVGSPDTYVANFDGNNYPAFLYNSTLAAGASATLAPWAFNLSTGVNQFQFLVTVDGQTDYDAVLNAVNIASGHGSSQDYIRTLTRPSGVDLAYSGRLADIASESQFIPCFAADGTAYLIADQRILRVDTSGNVTNILGTASSGIADGTGFAASFTQPNGITCSADGKTLFIADYNTVRRATGFGASPDNWTVTTIAGTTATGNIRGPGNLARFSQVAGVALSANGRTVYATDVSNHQVVAISPDFGSDLTAAKSWNVVTLAGSTMGYADGLIGAAKFNSPFGICVTPVGDLLIADRLNFRIRKVTTAGVVTTLCGNGTSNFVDGPGATAEVSPTYVAADSSGYAYFTDESAAAIRRVSPSGEVLTVASTNGQPSDGNCATSGIQNAFSLAVSPTGVLWFDDQKALRSIERIVGG